MNKSIDLESRAIKIGTTSVIRKSIRKYIEVHIPGSSAAGVALDAVSIIRSIKF
jgi:hypothetical protein